VLTLADGGVIWARRVILATGYLAYWHMPPALEGFSRELISYSAEHRDLSRFAQKDVTIVGRGQSALETAALLHEQGTNVRVLARAGQFEWGADPNLPLSALERVRNPDAALGPGWRSLFASELPRVFRHLPAQARHDFVMTSWGPFGGWWLKERVVDRVPLLTSHTISKADERGGRVMLTVQAPGKTMEIETDHVIAATALTGGHHAIVIPNSQAQIPGIVSQVCCTNVLLGEPNLAPSGSKLVKNTSDEQEAAAKQFSVIASGQLHALALTLKMNDPQSCIFFWNICCKAVSVLLGKMSKSCEDR
jgi:hypothetical protein